MALNLASRYTPSVFLYRHYVIARLELAVYTFVATCVYYHLRVRVSKRDSTH